MIRVEDARFLSERRLKILTIGLFIVGLLIIGRLFQLQVLGRDFYGEKIYARNTVSQSVPAERGRISVYEGEKIYPVAVNVYKYNLIVSPAEIDSPNEWVEKMSSYLGLDLNQVSSQQGEFSLIKEGGEADKLKSILNRLSQKNDFYELLKKDVSAEEAEAIKNLGLKGITLEPVPQRYYPEKSLFAHITGFVSKNENCDGKSPSEHCNGLQGQYGLEEFFNQELSGVPGWSSVEKAPGGYLISSSNNAVQPPKNGIDLVLTLNRSIQFFVCRVLEDALKEYQASSGSIIVIAPETSAVLALCNKPDFDPNQYSEQKSFSLFKNSSIASMFEPGSIFKIITMAMALDTKEVTPETSYYDRGSVQVEDYVISNVEKRSYGQATMTNVLERSINTGAVYAANLVGREKFRNYLKKFGFGSLTGIELAGEALGDIKNLEEESKTYLATASFGQGISVTSIQMVNAIAAIANSGKLMKPYLVQSWTEDGNKNIRSPQFIRQVISPSTAATLTAMMVSVLENGYGRLAKVKGYYVAGKTGTAQIPKKGRGYSEDAIHSFVGFAPATNPKFVALVKLDNPKIGNFAESTAAPVFGKIADFILKYYNVPPDKKE